MDHLPFPKTLAAALTVALFAGVLGAANPPALLNHQGVLRDNLNQPLNGTYLMKFRFFDAGAGTEILSDTHGDAAGGTVVVTNGLFSVQLGSGTVSDGAGPGTYTSLDNVFRDFEHVLLRVEVEGKTLSPDVRIVAGAYAQNASFLGGLHDSQFLRSDQNDTSVGNLFLAGNPSGPAISQGLLYVNPSSANPDETLIGVAASGVEKFRVDTEGDTTVAGSMSVDGSGTAQAWIGSGDRGIESWGFDMGGFFQDTNQSGQAKVAFGNYGIQGFGNTSGGFFVDTDGSGYVYAGVGERGVEAYGNETGGFFKDFDNTGYAYVGWADQGIRASGNQLGGYFADIDHSGFSYVGYGDRGIESYGSNAGGYFKDLDSGSQAYLAYGFNGVRADGGNASFGAVYATNPSGTWSELARSGVSTDGNGSKSFVQNHPYDKDRVVRYISLEGDEAGTYTRGSGRLENGVAKLSLGKTFEWVTNPDIGLTAHLTARGSATLLFVESLSTTEIVVRGPRGSTAEFDYIVHGLRIGFEQQTIVAAKRRESLIPAMEVDDGLFERQPELLEYTALARFEKMAAATTGKHAQDRSRAEALEAAIGRYDPEIHGAVDQLRGFSNESDRHVAGQQDLSRSERSRAEVSAGGSASATTERHVVEPRVTQPFAGRSFPVSVPVERGDVLVFDRELAGSLRPGSVAGDSAVAGVALVVDPETREAGVAFGGVAMCKVDAGYGEIRVGDLLAVSPTPGHAMRVLDPRPGTILGKAAEALATGTGTIQVLVSPR